MAYFVYPNRLRRVITYILILSLLLVSKFLQWVDFMPIGVFYRSNIKLDIELFQPVVGLALEYYHRIHCV